MEDLTDLVIGDLIERSVPKKPISLSDVFISDMVCPHCFVSIFDCKLPRNSSLNYCWNCGQALDCNYE